MYLVSSVEQLLKAPDELDEVPGEEDDLPGVLAEDICRRSFHLLKELNPINQFLSLMN